MNLTRHARGKGKKRCGINQKVLKTLARRALELGIGQQDAEGDLRKYLDSLFLRRRRCTGRIFAEHVFIFAKDTLVTLYRVPERFRDECNKLIAVKKELANPEKC